MSGPVTAPLRMQTNDGSVDGIPINTIKVTNGDLSISGSVASLDTSGSGGGAFSFDLAGDAGSTQTVNNGATMTLQGGSSGADLKFTMSATNTATLDLQNTTVTPGSYSLASITVDAKGRITAASSGSVSVPSGANPSATVSGTAVNGSATTFMRSDAAPALADTAVTPGSYTYSSITVDQQGRLTSASSGTPPAVDGSGASTQVTYWQDSDTITGSSNMTFDGTNLTVGGYVKGGNVRIGDGTGEIETDDANDLVFKTNTGTDSGTLTLKNGTNGNLIFDPDGSGLLQIEGTTNPGAIKLMCEAGTHGITIQSAPHASSATYTLVLPGALPADADNKYLVSDTSGNMSFTSAGGGGGTYPLLATDGSAAAPSYSFASDTNTGIFREDADAISFSVGGTRKIKFTTSGLQMVSGQIQADGSTITSGGGYSFSGDTDTGIEKYFANYLTIRTAGSPRFTIGSSGEILIGGTTSGNDGDAGTSGQVLTSAGASSPPTWTTPSAGGGGIAWPNSLDTYTGTFGYGDNLGIGFNGKLSTQGPNLGQWANSTIRYRPWICMKTGNLANWYIWVGGVPTGGSNQTWTVGLWNVGTNNVPGTLKCTSTIIISSSTGILSGTWTAEAGQDLGVKVGDTYWVGFYSSYSSQATSANLYWFTGASITGFPGRRPNSNTGSTSDPCRVYGSSGDISTIGDNPTITGSDTQTTTGWPIMWYTVS